MVFAKADTKKVFQGVAAAPRALSSTPAAAKGTSGPGITLPSFNSGLLVLPAAIVGIAGGALALSAADPKFAEILDKGSLRDSNAYAGYEPALKGGNIPTGVARKVAPKKKKGLF